MPKPEVQVPFLGITDARPFIKQPGDATDPDGILNVVSRDEPSGRRRLGTRDPLTLETSIAQGTGRVGGIDSISRASGVAGTQVTNIVRDTTGDSRPSGAFAGQCVILDASDRSVRAVFRDTRTTLYGAVPGAPEADKVCWHSTDPDIGYFFTITIDTANGDSNGHAVTGVNRFSLLTNTITGQNFCVDDDAPTSLPHAGAFGTYINHAVQYQNYLFVAAGFYIYTFRADTLTYLKRTAIDWSLEVQGLACVTVNGKDYLLALTTGHPVVSGPIIVDAAADEEFGQFYRAGILLHEILYSNNATKAPVATAGTPFIRRAMPMGLATGDPGFEDHRSFRFSEWGVQKPRGCIPYSFAVVATAGGAVYAYVARTNQGWGYDGNDTTQRPDGQAPYISCCRVVLTRAFEADSPIFMDPDVPVRYGMSAAVGGWERDLASLRRAYAYDGNTYQNDIPAFSGGVRDPHSPDNEPTLFAVAVDEANNRAFFAGRRSNLSGADGSYIYCVEADTGTLIWEAANMSAMAVSGVIVGGKAQQNSISVDPATGNLFVGMLRCTGFELQDGSESPDKAEALELSGETGQLVNSFDLTDGINFNSVWNANTYPFGCYGTACNSRGQVALALNPARFDQ